MASQNRELKKAGLKVTAPRLKILAMLSDASEQGDHLSAEDLYQRLRDTGEDIGLATVYRVLTQFETAEMIIRHNFEAGYSVFEMAPDDHHDHMVDVDTNEVIEFIDEEINHVLVSFGKLSCPKGFLLKCLKKARIISSRGSTVRSNETRMDLVVPTGSAALSVKTTMNSAFRVIPVCGKKITDLVNRKPRNLEQISSIVYEIPCDGCHRSYIGETHRGLATRVAEHRRDLRLHVDSNALVSHREDTGHLPQLCEARIVARVRGKSKRKRTYLRWGSHQHPRFESQNFTHTGEKSFLMSFRSFTVCIRRKKHRPDEVDLFYETGWLLYSRTFLMSTGYT